MTAVALLDFVTFRSAASHTPALSMHSISVCLAAFHSGRVQCSPRCVIAEDVNGPTHRTLVALAFSCCLRGQLCDHELSGFPAALRPSRLHRHPPVHLGTPPAAFCRACRCSLPAGHVSLSLSPSLLWRAVDLVASAAQPENVCATPADDPDDPPMWTVPMDSTVTMTTLSGALSVSSRALFKSSRFFSSAFSCRHSVLDTISALFAVCLPRRTPRRVSSHAGHPFFIFQDLTCSRRVSADMGTSPAPERP